MSVFAEPEEYLRKLSSHNISDAEIYFSKGQTLLVEYAGGTYKSKEFSSDAGYGIRIIHKGRVGFSHSNIENDFSKTAESAIKLASVSPKTSFSFEPAHKTYPKVKTTDPKLAEIDTELAFSAIREIREAMSKKADPSRISISFSEGAERIANTESLYAQSKYTSVSIYAEAKKERGQGFALYSSRFLPEEFSKFGAEAGEMASQMAKSKSIPSQSLTVNVSLPLLSSLLDFLLFHFDGDNKRRGITSVKEGEKKFHNSFTLLLNPLSPADSSGPFDGDGVPSTPQTLIENGVVKNFIYDRYSASLEKVNKKGSCQRSDYASMPSPGISNLTIPPIKSNSGSKPENYLEIISFHGLHTSDPVSGDFGVEVDIAFLHKKGKTTPVTNVLLTGNIFNLFNNISYLWSTQSTEGNLVSPEIWFSDLKIVGK